VKWIQIVILILFVGFLAWGVYGEFTDDTAQRCSEEGCGPEYP
jgi:hypothetical protein